MPGKSLGMHRSEIDAKEFATPSAVVEGGARYVIRSVLALLTGRIGSKPCIFLAVER